jgi:HD superfamily phosphohydrolase
MQSVEWLDAIYGRVLLHGPVVSALKLPLVQRLRHLRLSNIDSISSPGISGISRYEHALGTALLASRASVLKRLDDRDRDCFITAALLHDTALTPFGHLVEEALGYSSVHYDHERKWSLLLEDDSADLGGIDLQIYCGRESGLRKWAFANFSSGAEEALSLIFDTIKGRGNLGACLAADIDLDNLDNVTRAAYHMGLKADRQLPLRVAQAMGIDEHGVVVFTKDAIADIKFWLEMRKEVYSQFILAREDFAGKIMLLSATVSAVDRNLITQGDWRMSDNQYLALLLESNDPSIEGPVSRWLLNDLWTLSTLMWFDGQRPSFDRLGRFNEILSAELDRTCFCYGISDKRSRSVKILLEDGSAVAIGEQPRAWVLGVASPLGRRFTKKEEGKIGELISEHFDCTPKNDPLKQQSLPLFEMQ